MTQHSVLVVGGGIAGPATAYWLAKGGFKVTIIERASKLYKSGQGIDLTGPSEQIVQFMGLLDEVMKHTTDEAGFAVLDDNAQEIASIGGGLTREIEIMRGELAEILVNAATAFDNVSFRYATTIESIHQEEDGVHIGLSRDGAGTSEKFWAVVGADGMRSTTRELAFDPDAIKDCFKARDHYIGYFTIPRESGDGHNSMWQNATDGRAVLIRPVSKDKSSAYLNVANASELLESALKQGSDEQKEALASIFEDVDGLGPRAVKQMMTTDDFYFERIAQVKLASWHKGRCALVGDAGYAPSPITGEGTHLAIIGAYLLAGELSQNPDDLNAAFEKYESRFRGYVEKAQTLPLGGNAPRLGNPKTGWGVKTFRAVFKFVAWSGIWKAVDPGQSEEFQFPLYPTLVAEQ